MITINTLRGEDLIFVIMIIVGSTIFVINYYTIAMLVAIKLHCCSCLFEKKTTGDVVKSNCDSPETDHTYTQSFFSVYKSLSRSVTFASATYTRDTSYCSLLCTMVDVNHCREAL